MTYKFTDNAPTPIDEEKYRKLVMADFRKLLSENGNDEKVFQSFLEANPSLVPGAKSEFEMWGSGHGPLYEALISQPKIDGLKTRFPDFLWLSYDSVVFSPVFIEIEAPNKKYFNKDDTPTSEFTKARDQLVEWQTILSKPSNLQKFYSDFRIPNDVSELLFEPYFVLIYGRREEYIKRPWLKQKRAHLMGDNRKMILMSYDRLEPKYTNKNFICCNVSGGEYKAKNITPIFKIGTYSDNLLDIGNLVEVVDKMHYTSDERKEFLKNKIPYCLDYLKTQDDDDNDEMGFSFTLADLMKQTDE